MDKHLRDPIPRQLGPIVLVRVSKRSYTVIT